MAVLNESITQCLRYHSRSNDSNFHLFFSLGSDRSILLQVPIKPVELPVQALDQVLRFPCPCQVVVLAREDHQFGRHPEMFQRPEPLLALLDRHPLIVFRVEHERRRLHVRGVADRRIFPVSLVALKNIAAEIR